MDAPQGHPGHPSGHWGGPAPTSPLDTLAAGALTAARASFPGNKSDLAELREVPLAEAQSLADHYDILCAIETSAKDSSNVEEAFLRVATELIVRHGGPMISEKGADHIQLDSKAVGEGWGCGC
ncbi:Ras-related protein Rab-43 [Sciurus carolinensis]|uniref:Ras-related protein Rab-43 n=1 Tax=Sciurus carolinensis TaxID=30640 RepID=A0AA41T7C5_SCICA|nr:Ras-related protein Rab-43 [Sciurus carolinensis]